MGKRRLNAKKIAKQPLLKKQMAQFCAQIDVEFGSREAKDELLLAALANGNRGFISMDEAKLGKEFDKRIEMLRTRYSELKKADEEAKNGRYYRVSEQFVRFELWYEEGVRIANEVFEEEFLA